MRITGLTFIVLLHSVQAFGQIGTNDIAVKEKVALYTDYLREDNLESAKVPLEWLLKNTPAYDVSIYQNAEKIYTGLLKFSQHVDTVKLLQYSMIESMDARMKYFGDEMAVMKRKAFWMYSFWKSDASKYSRLLTVIDSAMALNEGVVPGNLFIAKMDIMRRLKMRGEVSDWELLNAYDDLVDELKGYEINQHVEKALKILEEIAVKFVKLDCDELSEWINPKLINSPGDTVIAKQVLRFSHALGCTDSRFYQEAAEILFHYRPNIGLVKLLASRYYQSNEFSKADETYQKGLELANSEQERFELLMLTAINARDYGNRVKSLKYARMALETGAENQKAYEFIGDLIFTSHETCRQGKSIVSDRAIFWLAFDYYQKSGKETKMKLAREQFPSITEIFNEEYVEGEDFTVTCWVVEKTQIRRRVDTSGS